MSHVCNHQVTVKVLVLFERSLRFGGKVLRKEYYTSYTEILQIWSEVSFNPCVTSVDHYLSSSLWHNSLIKIDNRPVFYKSWYAKGVEHVAHLMKDSTTFLSYHEFEDRFGIKSNFLTFQMKYFFFRIE